MKIVIIGFIATVAMVFMLAKIASDISVSENNKQLLKIYNNNK